MATTALTAGGTIALTTATQIEASLAKYNIPEHLRHGIMLWITQGIEPGGMLCAVINNDLRGAMIRADHQTISYLHLLVVWMKDNAPIGCCGHPHSLESWKSIKQALPNFKG